MTELVAAERNMQRAIETGQEPSPSSADSSRRVLVVVDEPCTSLERCASIRTDAGSGPTDALVIAPTHGAAATRWYVDEDAARADAAQRLRACVACLAGDGIRAEGRPGDSDPVQAITDALQVYAADEIQLITAPQRPSTWHHQNVIDRARGSFEQPIKHVVMPMQGETQASSTHSPEPRPSARVRGKPTPRGPAQQPLETLRRPGESPSATATTFVTLGLRRPVLFTLEPGCRRAWASLGPY